MTQQSTLNGYKENTTQTIVNMEANERNISLAGGAALVLLGLVRRGWLGAGVGALGAFLVHQGSTGFSLIYKLLGTNRAVHDTDAAISVPHQQGKHVSTGITLNRPISEVYDFWRDFKNLPVLMPYLKAVEVQSPTRSHWVVNGPVGMTIEWDAEIINDERDRVIGWRSLENPYVDHAGSVRFSPTADGEGTEVQVQLEYLPVGGAVGMALSNIIGVAPEQQLAESLRRLKDWLEVDTFATPDQQNSDWQGNENE